MEEPTEELDPAEIQAEDPSEQEYEEMVASRVDVMRNVAKEVSDVTLNF